MNHFRKVALFSFVTMILTSFLFTLSTPVSADVDDVESQNQRITKTEMTDPKDDPGDNDDSVLDRLTDWGKKIISDIKVKLIDVKDLVVDEWSEFTDWAEDKWKDFKDWSEEAWDDLKEFFSQEWVQTVIKVIGAIVVVAGIILVGAWVLAAVGIALSVGVVVGAIAFGAIGVLLTAIGGDTSFKGMLAGGLSSGIASLAGLGVLRALSIFKFLPKSGFLRVVTLGLLGGSGAVGFTILHGAMHYLFTGDSSLWKEAFTLNSLLLNFTIGGVMGPVAAKIFSSVGTQTIKGPGKWVAGILAKYTKKPATKIASSINRGWGAFKASSIYSGLNGATTTVFDGVTQWKEKGTIDWKKAGKRAAITIATTMVLVGAGTYFAPKFVIHSCACDDPAITKISQKANVAEDSVAGKGTVNNTLNPKDIHYMQSSIKNKTGDYTVTGNANALKAGTLSPTDLKTINVWKDDAGKIWTLDHRRLAAFRMAEIDEIPVNWASKEIVNSQMWKMTTKSGGTSIRLKLEDGTSNIIK